MTIPILYEDRDVLAAAKPSGQVTIPGRGNLPGLPLSTELEQQIGRKLFVVHRLDRGASGIVLFAKNAESHRHLSLQFEKRLVHKSYDVLVQGVLAKDGEINQPIRAFGSGRMGVHPQGKESRTEYQVVEKLERATLLKVTPQTGRRHQIRVHLYSIGHPVIGDPAYGKDRPVDGGSRLMLHASALEVTDQEGKLLKLSAGMPPDFKDVLRQYGSKTVIDRDS